MKKKQTLILSIGISLFLLLGIVGLKYHNRIYAWTLGDVQSLYAQAESLYQQKEYEEAKDSTSVNDTIFEMKMIAR